MLVHMIYTYIQQGVLATKSSHIKVPSQVSLIDCLVFKQQKTIESFILKHRHYHQLLQRWGSTNHHMVVTSLVRHALPIPLPHPEISRIYLTPLLSLPCLGRHLWIYGWPLWQEKCEGYRSDSMLNLNTEKNGVC